MKNNKLFNVLFLCVLIFNMACTSLENEENIEDAPPSPPTSNLSKNTVSSTNVTGVLNYYTIHDTEQGYYTLTVSEKFPTSLQNPDWGNKIDFMVTVLPTQNITFNHREEPNFDLEEGEYYFNTANLVSEVWYTPFINSRPTEKMNVIVENGVATFTVEEAVLSDNFVAPITTTDKISVSFSIPVSGFTLANNSSTGDLVSE